MVSVRKRAARSSQPVTADHFTAIRTQSPFLRTLNLAETYSLRGVAEIGGSPRTDCSIKST